MNGSRGRVLIVEDEWLLADALDEAVRDLGFEVAGPVASVAEALDLLRATHVDAAMLDVSLGTGERSFPVASALAAREVPFVFLTGYVRADLPAEFAHHTILQKPLSTAAIGAQLSLMLARERTSGR